MVSQLKKTPSTLLIKVTQHINTREIHPLQNQPCITYRSHKWSHTVESYIFICCATLITRGFLISPSVAQRDGVSLPVAQRDGVSLPVAQRDGVSLPVAQRDGGSLPVAQRDGGSLPVQIDRKKLLAFPTNLLLHNTLNIHVDSST